MTINLSSLIDEWQTDIKEQERLDLEIYRNENLQIKYSGYLYKEVIPKVIKLKNRYNKVYNTKKDFYSGVGEIVSQTIYKGSILKDVIERDPEIQSCKIELYYLTEIEKLLNDILGQLKYRSVSIKTRFEIEKYYRGDID